MAETGNDAILVKIAVFGIAISVICNIGITILLQPDSDYSYEDIGFYRDQLVDFSGESMLNQTPWVLQAVYTPWNTSYSVDGHLDPDGWLFGESISYSEIGKSAGIRLDKGQKSAVPLSISDNRPQYTFISGKQWWADTGIFTPITSFIGSDILGLDSNVYGTGAASIWNFTGYRYVFDPTLPFSYDESGNNKTSSVDGSLSVVWYSYNGQEGLSGGLQIYGGDTLISNIAATDVIAAYSTVSGLASTYDFVFDGTTLTLSVRFDQDVLDAGVPLLQAWVNGDWTMAISATSAGNFLDIQNSAAYALTAGSMIDTYVDIFTFSVPSIDNPWMDLVLWLMAGLPMSVAMICITIRTVSAFKILG